MAKPLVKDPKVRVEQTSVRRGPSQEEWFVRWSIQNQGDSPFQILASRFPHGRFRSAEKELVPAPAVLPRESFHLECSVKCSEPPGTVVENAFLLLRVLSSNEPWRIFARLRVGFDEDGAPNTVTELITTQRIGHSVRKDELQG